VLLERNEMAFFSPFTGPWMPYPAPLGTVLEEPATDNTIDIGRPTKRYRTVYATTTESSQLELVNQGAPPVPDAGTTDLYATNAGNLVVVRVGSSGTCVTDDGKVPMAADLSMGSHDLTSVGNLNGTAVSSLVHATGASVSGNLPKYNDTSGTSVQDSGVNITNVVTSSGTLASPNVVSGFGGHAVTDSGISINNLLLRDGTLGMTGNLSLATHDIGSVGLINGNNPSNMVTTAGTLTSGHVVTGNGSKTVQDGTIVASNLLLADGTVAATGDLNLATHNLTNVGTINGTSAANLVNAPGTLTIGQIIVGGGIKAVNASTVAASNIMLADGTVAWTGNTDHGTHNLTNVGSLAFSPVTNGTVGITTAANISAGFIGECLETKLLSGSAVSLTSNATSNVINSGSLTAGDWEVEGTVTIVPSGANATNVSVGVNNQTATLQSAPSVCLVVTSGSFGGGNSFYTGRGRFNANSSQTFYLLVNATFASTCTAYGALRCRRVR